MLSLINKRNHLHRPRRKLDTSKNWMGTVGPDVIIFIGREGSWTHRATWATAYGWA